MENIVYNYSKLLGRMREKGVTQVVLAKEIGLSETSINFSLGNKRPFKQDEIASICAFLDIPISEVENYFFVETDSQPQAQSAETWGLKSKSRNT
jgi:DNA-binding XRE family transcriptional regulator